LARAAQAFVDAEAAVEARVVDEAGVVVEVFSFVEKGVGTGIKNIVPMLTIY